MLTKKLNFGPIKQLVLLVTIFLTAQACTSQNRIDLEKLTYKENVMNLLRGKDKIADTALIKNMSNQQVTVRKVTLETDNVFTNLPQYRTYAIKFFRYGDFEFSNEDLENDYLMGSVSAIVASPTDQKLVGLVIDLRNTEDAKKFDDHINDLYGKPTVVEPEPKPNKDGITMGDAAYVWRNIRPGFSLVMDNNYSTVNGKQSMETTVYILNNDAKTTDGKTALERILGILKG
jgi:hypothetical protein